MKVIKMSLCFEDENENITRKEFFTNVFEDSLCETIERLNGVKANETFAAILHDTIKEELTIDVIKDLLDNMEK